MNSTKEVSRKKALAFISNYEALIANEATAQGQAFWQIGLETAQQWLRLIDEAYPDPEETEQLMAKLTIHDIGSLWSEMAYWIGTWKRTIGEQ